MTYNLFLQNAVNKMVEDIWQYSALVLLDIQQEAPLHCQTICLDYSIIKDLLFTPTGFYVQLFLPLQEQGPMIEFEIFYSNIAQIVCYYDDIGSQITLFSNSS